MIWRIERTMLNLLQLTDNYNNGQDGFMGSTCGSIKGVMTKTNIIDSQMVISIGVNVNNGWI